MNKIICLDIREDIIERTAGHIISSYAHPGEAAVVFGGRRPSYFLLKKLGAKLGRSFFPPGIFSGDGLAEYIAGKERPFSRISDLDACFIIHEISVETGSGGGRSFPEFLPRARAILGLIERIDLENTGESVLRQTENLAKIGFQAGENLDELLSSIITIREKFHRVLKERGRMTRGLLYLEASRAIKKAPMDEFKDFIFCGIFYLHRTELEIVRSLREKNRAVLVFQGDPADWPVLDETARALGVSISAPAAARESSEISITACPDIHSQACAVREVLENTPGRDNTVLVLPESGSLIPLLSEISSVAGECNISMGYPVRRSITYRLFSLIIKAVRTSSEGKYYSRDYLNLIRHPFPKNIGKGESRLMARTAVHKIEETLKGIEPCEYSGSVFLSLEEIETSKRLRSAVIKSAADRDIDISGEEVREIIERLHSVFLRNWEGVSTFGDFAARISELMDFLAGALELSIMPLEKAAIEKFSTLAGELRDSYFSRESFGAENIFRIFEEYSPDEKISFRGTPLKGMQILGFLETRLLEFENVIVMDMNEGVIPSLSPYEPLVPAEILKRAGLKDITREEEIQRYHFKRLVSSARSARLFYREDDRAERSRFIEELVWEKEKAGGGGGVRSRNFSPAEVPDPGAGAVIKKTVDTVSFLAGHTYSASSLNTYIHCPLQFCYKYVQGLEEAEDLLREPEAVDVGNFIHELLERTFAEFIGSRPVIDENFTARFEKYLNAFFRKKFSRRMKSDAFMLKKVVEHRLRRFLEKERNRNVQKIISLEKEFLSSLTLASGKIKLKGFFDRVDMLDDGSVLILDYKTGSMDPVPSTAVKKNPVMKDRVMIKRKLKSLQLPIYIHSAMEAYPDSVVNAGIYNLRVPEIRPFFQEGELEHAGEINRGFMETAGFILEEILDINTPFEPDRTNAMLCGYCPYSNLCR